MTTSNCSGQMGRRMGKTHLSDGIINPGDVVINEVHWYGVNDRDPDGFDEFIELRNLTDQDISSNLWQIANSDDFVGLPPGSTIPANGLFTIVDHVLEPYEDGKPQDENSAFLTGDLIVNSFNDNRQARLYLKDGALDLRLKDPSAAIVDVAGDGGAVCGRPHRRQGLLMERTSDPETAPTPTRGTPVKLLRVEQTSIQNLENDIIATPGESNSRSSKLGDTPMPISCHFDSGNIDVVSEEDPQNIRLHIRKRCRRRTLSVVSFSLVWLSGNAVHPSH